MKTAGFTFSLFCFFSISLACVAERPRQDPAIQPKAENSPTLLQDPGEADSSATVEQKLQEAAENARARLGPILRAQEAERLARMKTELEEKGFSTTLEGLENLSLEKEARFSDRDNALALLLASDSQRKRDVVRSISEDESDFLRMSAVRYRLWLNRDDPSEVEAIVILMARSKSFKERFDFARELAYIRNPGGVEYLLQALQGNDLREKAKAIQALSILERASRLGPEVDFLQLLEQQLSDPAPEVVREIDLILQIEGFFPDEQERVQSLLRRVEALKSKSER